MDSNKESGFEIVLVAILAVLVVAVIGYVSWNAYSQSHKQTASVTPSSSNTSTPPTKATSATVTPTGTYLDIKELGIKILLNPSIDDAVYSLRQPQPTDGSKLAYISAQSLINSESDSKSYCDTSSAPLGFISETTTAPTYVGGQKPLPIDNKTLFKIGNNYYLYSSGQGSGGCGSGAAAGVSNSAFNSKLNAFQQAVTTMQPDTASSN